MSKTNLLKEENINTEDLLLDPNNPRFSKHHDEMTSDARLANEEVQADAYARMNNKENRFEIEELVEAIMTDGYIHVDKIFVKKVNSKYLVIEGNRRVTAIKKILKDHSDKISDERKKEISTMPCIVVDGADPEANNIIRKILGLRHHGSILQWKPLPAAFNLYQEYMMELCEADPDKAKDPNNFIFLPNVAKKVASTFSVKGNDVKQKVKLYRIYQQLIEASRQHPDVVNSDSFSMIEETIARTGLKSYFEYDEKSSTFSDEGIELMLDLYFGLRGNEPVITEASAGSSTVRDFAYVVTEGTEEDIRRITIDREKASIVQAEVKTKKSRRSLQNTLELVLIELGKINLGEIGVEGFAANETEYIVKIDQKLKQLKRAAQVDND